MAPDELGALRVQVSGEGDAMRLTLAAERPETLDLMRRHGDALLADLRQSGHGGAALAFGQWSGPAGSPARGAPARTDSTDDDATSPAPAPAPAATRHGAAGLDLRL